MISKVQVVVKAKDDAPLLSYFPEGENTSKREYTRVRVKANAMVKWGNVLGLSKRRHKIIIIAHTPTTPTEEDCCYLESVLCVTSVIPYQAQGVATRKRSPHV